MSLEELMKGFAKKDIALYLRSFNEAESPVPCSSDIMISPDSAERPNIIKKTKKQGRRSENPIKLVWEFLQYEALNRLFKQYQEGNLINVAVAAPFAVYPQEYALYTEFMPGFILKDFKKQVKWGFFVEHYDGKKIRVENSVAFHLGYLSRIKEIEGIYHSDYDLRHIIYDAEEPGISMIDLENTRFLTDKNFLDSETIAMKREWFNFAMGRGCEREELEEFYTAGRKAVEKPPSSSYHQNLETVAKEYGLHIRPSAGEIDKIDVGLQKPKIKEF